MALNLSEQLKVQRGELKPTIVENSLIELVHAAGINYAKDFAVTYKTAANLTDIDGNPVNPLAFNYVSKMLSTGNRMITSDGKALQSLSNVIAAFISSLAVATTELIEGATEQQWEDFINQKIELAFELFAQVKQEEKTDYAGL